LVFGSGLVGRVMTAVNSGLVRLARGLFSYPKFFVVEPQPSLEHLLQDAQAHSVIRTEQPRAASR
jgi:hypothetical protein